MDFKNVNSNGKNVITSNLNSMDLFYLKVIKTEFKNTSERYFF
jgi:hypothetical protein